ncbi:hypothetical protein DICVIV_07332 [Dictyocaulus viviparus]|uniref:Uncharacterized protein n=1 Tax=Dictyocaulus viviparus TaxID=29172 RepID=A0A0D8XS13_DICVI|nr:hypothetical protein DICVIV_07332 [Dictyocaulus viviparus]
MNINTEIPAPTIQENAVTPIGYDIPRDTISREFIKSAKTARQLDSQRPHDEGGFRQHLISSSSSSLTKLVNDMPRIVVS